jgi:hypothetical protein
MKLESCFSAAAGLDGAFCGGVIEELEQRIASASRTKSVQYDVPGRRNP